MTTKEEWSSATNPLTLLNLLRTTLPVCPTALRLALLACCRLEWQMLNYFPPWIDRTLEIAERWALGLISNQELRKSAVQSNVKKREIPGDFPYYPRHNTHCLFHEDVVCAAREILREKNAVPMDMRCALLRETLGNPFDENLFGSPTSNSLRIAQAIDADQSFEDLPILADALEEEGWGNPKVWYHCRQKPLCPHVKGCWVISLVLEKGGVKPHGLENDLATGDRPATA